MPPKPFTLPRPPQYLEILSPGNEEADGLTTPSASTLTRLLGSAILRPRLLLLMLRVAWGFRARGWWRHPPFLPLPPAEYLAWRFHTAYGDAGARPSGDDLGRYLRWTVRMRRTPFVEG